MSERLLVSLEDRAVSRRDRDKRPDSPAVRLLEALRDGDVSGVLAQCGPTTMVTAENMQWSCTGSDAIERWLAEARNRFPGLTFEPRVRHVGFGLVIEEARVRDVLPDETGEDAPEDRPDEVADDHVGAPDNGAVGVAAVGNEPAPRVDLATRAMTVWRDLGDEDGPPPALNMPMRVTVKHDDLQVHEIALGFPAALLKRALGWHVDPLEMSLSEVQSAFIAPVAGEFTTHTLTRPELTLVPPPAAEPVPAIAPEPDPTPDEPPRRRRRGRVLLVLLLLVALAGGGWYAVRARGQHTNEATPPVASPQPSPSPSASASVAPSPSPSASASKPPVTTQAPSQAPNRKPNVTLKSDLAFGFNSATLSPAARSAIAQVAGQVRRAGLSGQIYVEGYTDSLGSAAYGKVLSQRRADAVAALLQAHLTGQPVTIVSIGHGEADPVASNATAAGRQQNRRVTITLPKS